MHGRGARENLLPLIIKYKHVQVIKIENANARAHILTIRKRPPRPTRFHDLHSTKDGIEKASSDIFGNSRTAAGIRTRRKPLKMNTEGKQNSPRRVRVRRTHEQEWCEQFLVRSQPKMREWGHRMEFHICVSRAICHRATQFNWRPKNNNYTKYVHNYSALQILKDFQCGTMSRHRHWPSNSTTKKEPSIVLPRNFHSFLAQLHTSTAQTNAKMNYFQLFHRSRLSLSIHRYTISIGSRGKHHPL